MSSEIHHDAALARPATRGLRARPNLRLLATAAACRGRNTAALAITSLAGLLALLGGHAWAGAALIVCALGVYGVLVFADLFNGALIREVHELESAARSDPSRSPALAKPLALDIDEHTLVDRHLVLVTTILSTHEAIRCRLRECGPGGHMSLIEMFERSTDLARGAAPLVRRGRELFDYLAQHDVDRLAGKAGELDELARDTSDDRARASFRSAARAARAQLASRMEIQNLFDRITGRLSMICSSLQLLEARLIELIACSSEIIDQSIPDEVSDLLSFELAGLEAVDQLA